MEQLENFIESEGYKMRKQSKQQTESKFKELNIDYQNFESINDVATGIRRVEDNRPVVPSSKRNVRKISLQNVSDDYVSEIVGHCLTYYTMPFPESNKEISDRAEAYFINCFDNGVIPTIEGCSLAIGIDSRTFRKWLEDDRNIERYNTIQRIRSIISAIDANLVLGGKENVVAYIFRSKNFYNMSDTMKIEATSTRDEIIEAKMNAENLLKTIMDDVAELDED